MLVYQSKKEVLSAGEHARTVAGGGRFWLLVLRALTAVSANQGDPGRESERASNSQRRDSGSFANRKCEGAN